VLAGEEGREDRKVRERGGGRGRSGGITDGSRENCLTCRRRILLAQATSSVRGRSEGPLTTAGVRPQPFTEYQSPHVGVVYYLYVMSFDLGRRPGDRTAKKKGQRGRFFSEELVPAFIVSNVCSSYYNTIFQLFHTN
jgi:hypothetical protein